MFQDAIRRGSALFLMQFSLAHVAIGAAYCHHRSISGISLSAR